MGKETRHLRDIFSDLLVLAQRLRECQGSDDPSPFLKTPEKLKAHLKGLLEHAHREAMALEIDNALFELARNAVIAFVDEMILKSHWTHREAWASHPLQLDILGVSDLGERFFSELEICRAKPGKNTDLLELYYLCLALGFEGQHGQENVVRLCPELLQEVQQKRKAEPSIFSLGKRPEELGAAMRSPDVPTLAIVMLSLGLLVSCYLVLGNWVSEKADVVKKNIMLLESRG